jgi:hypothetical protein
MGADKTFSAAAPDAFDRVDGCRDLLGSGDPMNRKLDVACARRLLQCVKVRIRYRG